jgi:signal transduction histidine kinase
MRPANRVSPEPGSDHERFIPHVAQNTRGDADRHSKEKAALRRENRSQAERIHELEAQVAALEDFSAMAAHELLKPLSLAEATAATVLDRASSRLDLLSQDDLQRMTRASARVRLMVEALLADSRQGNRTLQREKVDLARVVGDCLDLLRPEIDAKGARIVVDPMPMVDGNRALLNGAVGNLVANALKYGSRSNTEIRIGIARENGGWRFTVDTPGRQIPARERTVIFDPWRRGQNERRARGHGLGLAIVRRIVERHGGEVGVLPLNGRGNRFYFTLPA